MEKLVKTFENDSVRVEVTMELRERDDSRGYKDIYGNKVTSFVELSLVGEVWYKTSNGRLLHESHSCGQIRSELSKAFSENADVQELCALWERWHLNGMRAGNAKQNEFLAMEFTATNPYTYNKACKALKNAGLYEHEGYKYGHAWLCEELPEEVIKRVREIMAM